MRTFKVEAIEGFVKQQQIEGSTMCSTSCLNFADSCLKQVDLKDAHVLEVGSRNVNGSVRSRFESLSGVGQYTGVDIEEGPGVDRVCSVHDLVSAFGPGRFDLVITTEMLEHVHDWRDAIHNLKTVIKENGVLLLTTRSRGFGYHEYPSDFWRFERDDMQRIFSDFDMMLLESDSEYPGIFVLACKPAGWQEADLSEFVLYSILRQRRCDLAEGARITLSVKLRIHLLNCRQSLRHFVPAGFRRKLYDLLYR